MNISKKIILCSTSLVLTLGLVGCGGDDLEVPVIDIPVAADPALDPVVSTAGDCPLVGNLTIVETAPGQCTVGGTLTEDATLTADTTWFLDGALQVGTTASSAVLTIDPGTQIRGSGTDHLLSWPGSAIQANGTSANPVQMLPDSESLTTAGEWGGVFLRGFTGLPTMTGTDAANVLDYVVVAGAGAPTSVTIDGVTNIYEDNIVVNGVDETSILTFVQSHFSARDGFHILNTDARMSWLLATGATRDGVWYRDFNGLIKDLMVIHNPDEGRSGIYASETTTGDSFPRIVNATLVGRASASTQAPGTGNQYGILFADNTDAIRLANVLIADFTNGCFEVNAGADLSAIDTAAPGSYLDGVHCANNNGANSNFGVVEPGSVGLPASTIAPNNNNSGTAIDGFVYYNGVSNPIVFTGEIADRSTMFTQNWYLANIGGRGNGLAAAGAPANTLNGFLDGDTDQDGDVDTDDTMSPFIISSANPFNLDVAGDTGGYDLTHVGASRSGGAPSSIQFDGWTVATGPGEGFLVEFAGP